MQQFNWILIFCLCFSSFVRSQGNTSVKKEVRKYVISYNKNSDSTGKLHWIDTYDRRGNLIQQFIYSANNQNCQSKNYTYLSKTFVKYNSWNEKIEQITYTCDQTFPTEKIYTTYVRNKQNQVILIKVKTITQHKENQKPTVESSFTRFMYNENGDWIKVTESFGRSASYLYDKNNNCTYIFSRTLFRRTPNVSNYKYDKRGNCISYSYKGERSCHLITTTWKKKFNKLNQMTYYEKCNGTGCFEAKYEYNSEGRMKRKIKPHAIEEYSYHKNGDLTEILYKDLKEKIYKVAYYTYVYY